MDEDAIRYEVMPDVENASKLPDNSIIPITMSSKHGLSATLTKARRLQQMGFRTVPHIAARMVEDTEKLQDIHEKLERMDIHSVLVIGGDIESSIGEFNDSVQLIKSLSENHNPTYDIGISGYPEGHNFISDERLWKVLNKKERYADYIVCQICFRSGAVSRWCRTLKSRDISLPVLCSVPTSIENSKLEDIVDRIGVNKSNIDINTGRGEKYSPVPLIDDLLCIDAVNGIHINTFNRIDSTIKLYEECLKHLSCART